VGGAAQSRLAARAWSRQLIAATSPGRAKSTLLVDQGEGWGVAEGMRRGGAAGLWG
jgi:hypothetical protein